MTFLVGMLKKLKTATSPEEVFGELLAGDVGPRYEELRVKYNGMARMVHPDHHGGSQESHEAMALLNVMRDRAEKKIEDKSWGKVSEVVIKANKTYKNVIPFAKGDICDIYMGETDGPRAVIKIVRELKDQDLLQNEARILKKLWEPKDKAALSFQRYLPKLLEQTKVKLDGKERLANILETRELGYTLEQVHEKYPHGLDPRNVAWIWKRLLEITTWVSRQGVTNGAILPQHVMVFPKDHGCCLLGWPYACTDGHIKAISMGKEDFYPPEVFKKQPAQPSTDIYMIAKCMMYLLGGDRTSMPDTVPPQFGGLFYACFLPKFNRSNDPWEVYEQLTYLLRRIYGPKKFVELEM